MLREASQVEGVSRVGDDDGLNVFDSCVQEAASGWMRNQYAYIHRQTLLL